MIEVTLQMTEDDLKEFIDKEFDKLGKWDNEYAQLYKSYFHSLIDNGSASFLFGPTNLKDWISLTVDNTEVIDKTHKMYDEVKKLWDSKEFESNTYIVVENYRDTYLIEYL